MDLLLKRYPADPDGIFGVLYDPDGVEICETLEHNFNKRALIPPGRYRCVRGMHRLKADGPEFETFEVTGVAGHWGLLFHVGNYNRDSKGCILVGDAMLATPSGDIITGSKSAFTRLMQVQYGVDEFFLTITE